MFKSLKKDVHIIEVEILGKSVKVFGNNGFLRAIVTNTGGLPDKIMVSISDRWITFGVEGESHHAYADDGNFIADKIPQFFETYLKEKLGCEVLSVEHCLDMKVNGLSSTTRNNQQIVYGLGSRSILQLT